MATANVQIKKILVGRGNTAVSSAYLGTRGEITMDTDLKTLRIHDGSTRGGTRIATYDDLQNVNVGNINLSSYATTTYVNAAIANVQAGSTYSNSNVIAYLSPFYTYANATYSTIANAATQQAQINAINANVSAANGAITTANTGMKSYVDAVTTAWTANAASQATDINGLRANITAANVTIGAVITSWTANAATQGAAIATLQSQVYTNTNAASYLAGNVTIGNLTVASDGVVLGNLRVQGTQTAVNTAHLDVTDLYITVANGSVQASDADGAGLRIAGALANIAYSYPTDSFVFNKPITANLITGNIVFGDGTFLTTGVSPYGDANVTALFEAGIAWVNPDQNPNPIGGHLYSTTIAANASNNGFRISNTVGALPVQNWTFTKQGKFTLPFGSAIDETFDYESSSLTALRLTAGEGIWTFDTSGNLTLPFTGSPSPFSQAGIIFGDGTLQQTAWTGLLPNPTFSGSDQIGNLPPAPLNLNNTGASGDVETQLRLINTAGGGGTGTAIDFHTYTDVGNGVPVASLRAVDDGNYSSNFSIALKGTGNGGEAGLTTAWTFGSDGVLTIPITGDIVRDGTSVLGGGSNYSNTDVTTLLSDFGANNITTASTITANQLNTNGNLFIGNLGIAPGSAIVQVGATLLTYSTGNPESTSASFGWAEQLFAPANVAAINFNSTGERDVRIDTGIATSAYEWTFGADGSLNLPNHLDTLGAVVQSTSNVRIISDANTWSFGTDGNLIIPPTGDILRNGTSVLGSGTVDHLAIRNSGIQLDGNTVVWGGGVNGANNFAGFLGDGNTLFTFAGGGPSVMSSQLDGSLFVGDVWGGENAEGVTADLSGWIVASSGIKSKYNVYAGNDLGAGANVTLAGNILFTDGTSISGAGGLLTVPNGIRSKPGQYYVATSDTSAEMSWSNAVTAPGTTVYSGLGSGPDGTWIENQFIESDSSYTTQLWTFGTDGNLTIAGNINFANGVNILSTVTTGNVFGNISTGRVNFNQNSTIALAGPRADGSSDRLRLWDFYGANPSGHNYAIGAEPDHVWFGMDVNSDSGGFKFYSRANLAMKIGGLGTVTLGANSQGIFWNNGAAYSGNTSQLVAGSYTARLDGPTGKLFVPGYIILPNGEIRTADDGGPTIDAALTTQGVTISSHATAHKWYFAPDGQLKLPVTGAIGDTYGDTHGIGLSAGPGADDYAGINSHSGAQYIETNETAVYIGTDYGNTNKAWVFNRSGVLTLPGGTSINDAGAGTRITAKDSNPGILVLSHDNKNFLKVSDDGITIDYNDHSSVHNTWFFDGANNAINFPDGTQQTTAWTGVSIGTAAPNSPTGSLWYDMTDGRLYANIGSAWVDANPTVAPLRSYYLGNLTVDGEVINFTHGNLSIDESGTLLINGTGLSLVPTDVYNSVGSATIGSGGHYWTYNVSGNLVMPTGAHINYANGMSILSGITAGSTYGNSNVSAFIANAITTGNIIGNNTDPNVYVETSLGGTISTWTFGTNGVFTLPANSAVIQGAGTDSNVNIVSSDGTTTATWHFDKQGNLTLPTRANINFANGRSILSGLGSGTSTGNILFSDVTMYTNSNLTLGVHNNVYVSTLDGDYVWTFDDNGSLLLPGNGGTISNGSNSVLIAGIDDTGGTGGQIIVHGGGGEGAPSPSAGNVDITAGYDGGSTDAPTDNLNTSYGGYYHGGRINFNTSGYNNANPQHWYMDVYGNLSLPNGTRIDAGTAASGIGLTTDRGTVLFGNAPEVGAPNHYHIMKADASAHDLFFGDDTNYVRLPSTGRVEISGGFSFYNGDPLEIVSGTGINSLSFYSPYYIELAKSGLPSDFDTLLAAGTWSAHAHGTDFTIQSVSSSGDYWHIVVGENPDGAISATVTFNRAAAGASLTLPTGGNITYANGTNILSGVGNAFANYDEDGTTYSTVGVGNQLAYGANVWVSADGGLAMVGGTTVRMITDDRGGSAWITTGDPSLYAGIPGPTSGGYNWQFGSEGTLTLPGNVAVTPDRRTIAVRSQGGTNDGTGYLWILQADWLTAPADIRFGDRVEVTGSPSSFGTVTGPVVNADGSNQYWEIPTGTVDANSLFDVSEVDIVRSGLWSFGVDGSIKLPVGSVFDSNNAYVSGSMLKLNTAGTAGPYIITAPEGDGVSGTGKSILIQGSKSYNGSGTAGGDVTIAGGWTDGGSGAHITVYGGGGEGYPSPSRGNVDITAGYDGGSVDGPTDSLNQSYGGYYHGGQINFRTSGYMDANPNVWTMDVYGTLTTAGNIIPGADNLYTLGTPDRRWGNVHIGPGTLYITDANLATNNTAAITVLDGVLQINGANQLQVGELKFVDNTIESTSPNVDIQIGLSTATANILLNRNTTIATGKTLNTGDIFTTGNLTVSTNPALPDAIDVNGTTYSSSFIVSDIGSGHVAQTLLTRFSTSVQPIIAAAMNNSDDPLVNGDVAYGQALFQIGSLGYAGNNYKEFGGIVFSSEDNNLLYTISDTSAPGKIDFNTTRDGEVNVTTGMTLHCDQTLRFNNGLILNSGNVPSTSKGQAGDLAGMFIIDNSYIYYCTADYTDGTADIWNRTAQSTGNW